MTKKIGKKYWVLLPDNNKIGNFGPIDYFSSMYNTNVFPVEYSNPVNGFPCLPDKREGIQKNLSFVIYCFLECLEIRQQGKKCRWNLVEI